MIAGVMCSDHRILKISQAAAFMNRLEMLDEVCRESKQVAVAVIQLGKNKCNNK